MQENKGRRNPFLLAPTLALAVLALFGILSFVPIGGGIFSYIIVLVAVFAIFGSAIFLAVYLRGTGWAARSFGKPKSGSIVICLSAAGMMMVQSVGIRSFLTENFYDYRTVSLYGMHFESATESTGAFLLVFFAFVVIPAVAEEIFFRGFLMREYRYGGVFLSMLASSVLYAMTGLSLPDFPIHLINGILLSAVAFLTGNLLYPMLAHVLYALFVLSAEKYIFFIALETRALILLVLVALGLLSALCFCTFAEKILRNRGEDEERAPVRLKKGTALVVLMDMLSAPMLWADVFCFALVCILHIFLDA